VRQLPRKRPLRQCPGSLTESEPCPSQRLAYRVLSPSATISLERLGPLQFHGGSCSLQPDSTAQMEKGDSMCSSGARTSNLLTANRPIPRFLL
jgi:hypothetical protein